MWKLILSNLWRRRARTLLTAAAVALSVSLVVSTTSGYASAEKTVRAFVGDFLGTSDVKISAGSDADGIPESVLDDIRDDPAVQGAFGRLELAQQFRDRDGKLIAGNFNISGIDPTVDGYLGRLPLDSGRKIAAPNENVVMLDFGARDALGLSIGDTFDFPVSGGETVPLEVVGMVYKPKILSAFGFRTMYVPLETLQQINRPSDPGRVTTIVLEFKLDADRDAFLQRWAQRLAEINPAWSIRQVRQDREAVDRGLRAMNLLSLMGGMVSLTAATFIVFGTLSMGVAERQRTLAMLRAVGATRLQIAISVIGEGIGLALLGIAIGVPLGLGFVWALVTWFPDFFTAGMGIGWLGLIVAVVGMTLAATLAAAIPAWTASRVDPLAAMRPSAEPTRAGPPWQFAIAGLLLIGIDVLLLWPPLGITPLPGEWEKNGRFWAHFIVGLPALMVGFFLIAPMLVWLAEKLLATPAALIAGIPPSLLRQQLSGGMWRAAGTAAALMVGPAVLIVMNTQGRSGIEGWQLPDRFPDVFLFNRNGIGLDQIEKIASAKGIAQRRDGTADISPVGYLHPTLGDSYFAIAGSALQADKTMFIAVDPTRIFEMMALDFSLGDSDTATRMLSRGVDATLDNGTVVAGTIEGDVLLTLPTDDAPAEQIPLDRIESQQPGHYLIITQEFHELRGVGVGDPFTLEKPGAGFLGRLQTEPVDFTVVGVVRSPGIDVMVSTFDLGREFRGESAASVFGTIADARELFGMDDVFLVAANLEMGVQKEELLDRLATELGDDGISIGDVRELKFQIQEGLRNLLLVASSVAWAALVVASLGVTNTVMAGVRARRYQLGILRAVGVTRGEMMRLILAEALLLGLAAAALGVAAGLMMALNARQLSQWTIGYVPPLRVAWDVIGTGALAVLAVSLLASLWPAFATARTQTLRLLQAGRAAG